MHKVDFATSLSLQWLFSKTLQSFGNDINQLYEAIELLRKITTIIMTAEGKKFKEFIAKADRNLIVL